MRTGFGSVLALLTLALLPVTLRAQQGVIVARANDAATARPLPTVQVSVTGVGTQTGGITGDAGRLAVQVAPGTYTVTFALIGRETEVVEGVQVAAGQSVDVTVSLTESAIALGGLVVSASKRVEKKTSAPATMHTVSERTVEERPASTPADYLVGAPGVDIIRQGIQSTNVVVRGFNNIFSGALHALTDNRIAGIPSLRVNLIHFIPSTDDDVARMEVVLGPGSALYGPNTANGVLHIITKSPLAEQGTTVSLAGANRNVFKGMFRTAHLLGESEDFGVKLSGQFMRGRDWRFNDPFERDARAAADANPDAFRANLVAEGFTPAQAETAFERVGLRDFQFDRFSGEARADWRLNDDATLIFQTGLTSASGIELTGIGAGQTENWIYTFYQTRFNWDRLFAQLYLNRSDAGDSFLVRRGVPLVDNSNLLVGQVQHGFGLGEEMEDGAQKQDFTYGLDVFLTTPQTKGQINGQYEDDDEIDEVGAYIQSETALTEDVDLIAAFRVDKSSILDDPVFSPRAAVVYEVVPDQSVRFTYNRAFSTPTTLNYFLDINGGLAGFEGNPGFFTRALGPGRDGISFQLPDGSLAGVRSPFTPAALGGPGQLLPADPAQLWPIFLGVVQQLAARGDLPPNIPGLLAQLGPAGVGLNTLSPVDGSQRRASETVIPDSPPLDESTTETFEVGYQGIIQNRFSLSADVWYSKRKNFTSPLLIQTPLITYNAQDLQAKLEAAGVPAAQAGPLAAGLGGIPVGVVSSPDVVTQTADIVATYRNFGELDLFGWDIGFKAFLTDEWSLEGSASWVDDDFFVIRDDEEVDDPGTISDVNEVLSLNAPDFKGALSLGYRSRGFTGEVRTRYTSEFPVNSADFVGLGCVEGLQQAGSIRNCVESFTLVDLLLGYQIPDTNAEVQLSVTNLFDEEYRSFVGVPAIGQFAMLQMKYTF